MKDIVHKPLALSILMVLKTIKSMHDIKANFDIILDTIKPLLSHCLNVDGNLPKRGAKPLMPDIEVVALSMTAEFLGIDSENNLFVRLHESYLDDFPNLPERSRFNRRRRNLAVLFQETQMVLADRLLEGEDTFILDAKPLETVKFARAPRTSVCRGHGGKLPAFGKCISKKMTYFGFKFFGTVGLSGVFRSYDLAPANVHDVHYLNDIRCLYANCQVIADKGFLSKPMQTELFEENRVVLSTPMRTNQKGFKPFPKAFEKVRKRVETCFSQLDEQFNLWRNRAKTFMGLWTRVCSKVAAMTVIQFLNKFVLSKEMGHIKHSIVN